MSNTERDNKKAEIDAYIAGLGLEYKALFVPFSQSRNAKEKQPSLNWLVTISKGGASITTDYMQGIAHAPRYQQSIGAGGWKDRYYSAVAEAGKVLKTLPKFSDGRPDYYEAHNRMQPHSIGAYRESIPAPAIRDVLWALVMDSDVINYRSFEDWADNIGYDNDSREHEKLYKACLRIALELRALLGNNTLAALTTLFNDY